VLDEDAHQLLLAGRQLLDAGAEFFMGHRLLLQKDNVISLSLNTKRRTKD
jgi:hypothetical protein